MIIIPNNTFLFSDPHFDHQNIIKYCHRPFKTVGQMNETILDNYNKIVRNDSLVYFLGDMSFGKGSRPFSFWLKQLKGHIVCLRGNHDRKGFNQTVIKIGESYFKLVHSPYNSNNWTGWLIHGHLHNKTPLINYQNKRINVSVDATNFSPIRLSDIIKKVK